MNIFDLAYIQLKREGLLNSKNETSLMLERAITIKKWLDSQDRNKKVRANQLKNKLAVAR